MNMIGNLLFLTLLGGVERPSQQVGDLIARPGVDGLGIWRTGIRGRPFQLRSMVDVPDLAAGRMFFAAYRLLMGGALQILIQDGYNFFAAEGFNVAVLDVQLQQLKTIKTAVGGFNPPSNAKLVCEWTLVAVAIP